MFTPLTVLSFISSPLCPSISLPATSSILELVHLKHLDFIVDSNKLVCAEVLPQAISVLRNANKDVLCSSLNFISHVVNSNGNACLESFPMDTYSLLLIFPIKIISRGCEQVTYYIK